MNLPRLVFILLFFMCCIPSISNSGLALFLGMIYAIIFGNDHTPQAGNWGGNLLKIAVIGLGFGTNFAVLAQAGKDNAFITSLFVFSTLLIGFLISTWLGVSKKIGLLISAGTAICGGSAIVAIGSTIKADSNELSVSTASIFLLNAASLILFPIFGNWLELSQVQFGTWAAIAIHDMSSVVGSASKYGEEALQIASITKMLRVLWIIPTSLILVLSIKNKESFKVPLFIIGFIITSCIYTQFTEYQDIFDLLYKMAKQLMVVSLFLTGSALSVASLKKVGVKAISQAVILWLLVCLSSLIYIYTM